MMQHKGRFDSKDWHDRLCPNIQERWKLGKDRKKGKYILQSKTGSDRYEFDPIEGSALTYFTGQVTLGRIQEACSLASRATIDPNLVAKLLQKLVELGIVETSTTKIEPQNQTTSLRLKSAVHWINDEERGCWLLRNPEDVTYIKVNDFDKSVISKLGKMSLEQIAAQYKISQEYLQNLLVMLAIHGMLEGSKAIKTSGKFSWFKILFFTCSLFNPDRWLTRHVDRVGFIFTPAFSLLILGFISLSIVLSLSQQAAIVAASHELWANYSTDLIVPFIVLMMLVFSIHELAHAFTLKHYGGIVPEMGLLFIFLLPGAYTETTDVRGLVNRKQRNLSDGSGSVVSSYNLGDRIVVVDAI